jgi:phosphate transport system substrate-binding protein
MKKTIGILVVMALLAGILGAVEKKEKIIIDSASAISPIIHELVNYCGKIYPDVEFVVTKTNAAHVAESLINSTCDIAAESRFLTTAEYKAAADKNIYPVSYIIAMDGLVLMVHKDNPLKGLSLDQLRMVYAGSIRNWKEIGGPDHEIVKINREKGAGQLDVFTKLVMGDVKLDPKHITAASDLEVKKTVQENPMAIGYSSLGFVDKTVKALEIDFQYPEFLTIRGGLYPLSRPLFLFTNGLPKPNSFVYTFVSLYLNKEIQNIIEKLGFIPVTNY